MVNWLFFDIGNVLMIDEPLMALHWEMLFHRLNATGQNITFEELMARREERVNRFHDSVPHRTISAQFLGEQDDLKFHEDVRIKLHQDFMTYNFVLPGAKCLLETLSEDYNLAMAANQPKLVFRQAMVDANLLDYFKVVGISDEMGLKKPDPDFFEAILSEAGCLPSEAIMIGDRIDNDIAPAQKLGFRTIWFDLKPEAQGYVAKNEYEQLYIESLGRAPSRGVGAGNEVVRADQRITDLSGLTGAILEIEGRS